MLSYRHLFHAGSFADVFKHVLLTRLLHSLNQKDKPYFYLDIVRAENTDGHLRYYPGSPRIARRMIRPIDRIALTELNKTDCAQLQALFARDRRVNVQLMDGYQALKAHLPPKERRGLVLIDSSFDRSREFARLVTALHEAHTRWATGTYAV